MAYLGTSIRRDTFAALWCALTFCMQPSSAMGIDFKIELPPTKGVLTPDDEDFFDDVLTVTPEQSDSLQSDFSEQLAPGAANSLLSKRKSERQPVPANSTNELPSSTSPLKSPQTGPQRLQDKKFANKSSIPNINSFPNLSCLADNIDFWKKVYAEVDTHEAMIHDRDELDKVYGVVRLNGSEPQRKQSMRLLKEHYRQLLQSLAERLDSPKEWTASEKALVKLFRPSELTRSRLLQASENIRIQQGLKSRFNAGVQRSLQYLPTIKTVLRSEKMPLDIVYLPHVESSFVNHAKSKVGAVGLWQLMPDTMRLLMGRQAISKRTEPKIATQAAVKLLKQNFNATGSWPLALTAYNHGLGGVMRAVRSTASTDLCQIIARYNSPSFRFASSNFYAQFVAARDIALRRYSELSKNRELSHLVEPLIASRVKGAL
jgi:hypothetical protein